MKSSFSLYTSDRSELGRTWSSLKGAQNALREWLREATAGGAYTEWKDYGRRAIAIFADGRSEEAYIQERSR